MTSPVAIYGFGRFGRALAELFRDAGVGVRAWDPFADVPPDLRVASPEALADCREIVLATPVRVVGEAARRLRPSLSNDHLVLDVSSVKLAPLRELREALGSAVPWIGTHPLFGPTSIALGERPLVVVICPDPLHPGATARARGFYETIGCEVVEQEPEEHDRTMARTHALAFFVAKGIMDVETGERPFTPPSFRAMERTIEAVRSDASHLFATIQNDNPFSAEARSRLLRALESIDRDLARLPAGTGLPASAIHDLGPRAPDLRETRELIDDVDRELVRLLAKRALLSRRAGRAKAGTGRSIRDPERERDVLETRRRWAADEGLDVDGVAEVFRNVLRISRSLQREEGS